MKTRGRGAVLSIALFMMMVTAACAPAPRGVLLPVPLGAGDGAARSSPASAGAVAAEPRVPVIIEETDSGFLLSTRAYRIHSTLPDTRLRTILPTFMEVALDHYRTMIVDLPEPRQPMESAVFRTREEWLAFADADLGESAGMYGRLGRGGYTREGRSVLYDIGYFDTLTIAAHEGWHQYAQSTFAATLPAWLDEGLATYGEGCIGLRGGGTPAFLPWRNIERYSALKEVVRADAIRPLEAVVCGSPQGFLLEGRDALLDYYAQVWALVHFLMEYDNGALRPGLERMVLDAANGTLRGTSGGPRALARQFEHYFKHSPASLDAPYRDFVRTITARGAGNAVYQGVSPLTR